MGQEGVVRLLVNGQYIPRVKLNEYVYVNYESTSQDFFFFNHFTLPPALQGIPTIIILINFKKEGGASVVREVFFF